MRLQLKGWVIHAGIGVLSFGVGVGVGYFVAKRKITKASDEIGLLRGELESEQLQLDFKRAEVNREINHQMQQADHIIKELRELNKGFRTELAEEFLVQEEPQQEEPPTPILNLDELNESLKKHPSSDGRIQMAPVILKEDDNLVINVFPDEDDDWDYDKEVANRTPDHPYIIHRDEYFSNEMDFRQSTLTFYAGDQILCDEENVPIYNPERVAGKLIFGHGSRDISICYVRNERLQAEYEVLIDHGYFQNEVLGLESNQNIKHSRRVPKFKKE